MQLNIGISSSGSSLTEDIPELLDKTPKSSQEKTQLYHQMTTPANMDHGSNVMALTQVC